MRYILFFLMFSSGLFAQGIEPSSLQPTPYQGGILKGINPIVDPFTGETRYIYQHDTIVFNPDSIYISGDTIRLRDGSGFVVMSGGGGGSVDSIYLQNDTIFLRDGSGFVDLSGVQTTPDSIYISNDTIRLRDGSGFVDASAFGGGGGGTVTSVGLETGTTGTDVNVTGSPITTSGTFTLNIPTASGTNTGKLSNTDWTTFNNKVGGSGTATRIPYWQNSNTLTASPNLFYDPTNIRLGIGTASPNSPIHVINGNADFRFSRGNFQQTPTMSVENINTTGKAASLLAGTAFAAFAFENTGSFCIITEPKSFFQTNNTGNGPRKLLLNNDLFALGNNINFATPLDNTSLFLWNRPNNYLRIGNTSIIPTVRLSFGNDNEIAAGRNKIAFLEQANGTYFYGIGITGVWPNEGVGIWGGTNTSSHTSVIPGLFVRQENRRVGINTINPQRQLHVDGEARITDLVTDTPTRILGADADGDLGELKVGNGLSISNDSLIVTVSGGGDDWGTQVVESDITLLGDGTSGNLLKVDTSIIATHYDLTQININDADADPNNEIQNLSHTVSGTNRTINISGGTGTTISVADNDNSSSNELNTSLTVSHIAGNALPRVRITDAGGTLEGLVPFFSTSNVNAGVVPGSNGASTSNFLRADGIWATPVSSGMTNWNLGINNGSYTAVGDGANVSLNAGTNVTLSKSGNTVTINSPSRQTWADFGSNMQAWFSTGAYGSGKDVGIGVSPTADLDVNGTTRLRGPIFNSANSSGTSGQVLTSQGSGAWTWTTISSTDDQNLSYGTKSGARIPLDIQDGVGVNFDEGRGILLTRTSSNVLTVNGRRDWMHVSSSSFNQTLTANTWAVLNLSDSPSGYNFTWNNTTKRLTKTGFDGNVYLNFNCLARIGSTNTGTLEVGYFLNGSGTPFRVRNYTLANMSEDFEINLQENQYMGVNDYIEIKVRASADRTVNFDTPSFNAQPQDH